MDVSRELELALQAARAGDAAAVLMASDMLDEANATLTDVLLLYTGEPPEWTGSVPQSVLATWLAGRRPPDARAKAVSFRNAHVFDMQGLGGVIAIFRLGSDDGGGAGWATVPAARRYLKRRILSLFPEVYYAREIRLTNADASAVLEDGGPLGTLIRRGMRPEHGYTHVGGLVFVQTLAAPDWVPPHPEETARPRLRLAPSR